MGNTEVGWLGGGCRWFSRPEGAKTNQPRATPGVPEVTKVPVALKGRNKERTRGPCQHFVVPFSRVVILPDAVIPQGEAPRLTPLRSALGYHVTPLRGKRRKIFLFPAIIPANFPSLTATLHHPSCIHPLSCNSDVSGRSRRPGWPPRGGRRAGAGVGWSGEVIVVHQAAGLGEGLAAGLLRQAQGELGVLQQAEEGEALLAVDDHSIAVG